MIFVFSIRVHHMTDQRTIIHLDINNQHEYFGSPSSLYDKHSSDEIDITKAGLNNYFSEHREDEFVCYSNKKCVIRKGKLSL